MIIIHADNRTADNRTNVGERSPHLFAFALCGVVFAGVALTACAGQAVVAPFPDIGQTLRPPEAVMTVNEKDATIAEMQAQAKRNSERAGL